jgi:hypothetical protein
MKNRIPQFEPRSASAVADKSREAAAAISESASQAAETIRRWVADHPVSCLAAAFAAGVAIAWLIKRR